MEVVLGLLKSKIIIGSLCLVISYYAVLGILFQHDLAPKILKQQQETNLVLDIQKDVIVQQRRRMALMQRSFEESEMIHAEREEWISRAVYLFFIPKEKCVVPDESRWEYWKLLDFFLIMYYYIFTL